MHVYFTFKLCFRNLHLHHQNYKISSYMYATSYLHIQIIHDNKYKILTDSKITIPFLEFLSQYVLIFNYFIRQRSTFFTNHNNKKIENRKQHSIMKLKIAFSLMKRILITNIDHVVVVCNEWPNKSK